MKNINFFVFIFVFIIQIIFCGNVSAKVKFESNSNAFIDRIKHTINIPQRFTITGDNIKISGDSLNVIYKDFDNIQLNLKDQNFHNFKRIEALGNILINTESGLLKGDKYIYDVDRKIMILTSNKKPTTYKDKQLFIKAQDRFEFQEKENIIVLRGKPSIEFTSKDNNQKQDFFAQLIYAKLNNDRKDIKYIEAFNNIRIINSDGSIITADYAYYSKDSGIMVIEDNIKIKKDNNILDGCQVILNINSGESKIIPCGERVSATIERQ